MPRRRRRRNPDSHHEYRPADDLDRAVVKAADHGAPVNWRTPGLRVTRLRLVSDPGYPVWDVSYCVGLLRGKPVRVSLPFNELPKRGMRQALIEHAKRDNVYARGLGILDNISTLL